MVQPNLPGKVGTLPSVHLPVRNSRTIIHPPNITTFGSSGDSSTWRQSWNGYSRQVLVWRLYNTLETRFCLDCLDDALRDGQPLIFNSYSLPAPRSWAKRGSGSAWMVGAARMIISWWNACGDRSNMRSSLACRRSTTNKPRCSKPYTSRHSLPARPSPSCRGAFLNSF